MSNFAENLKSLRKAKNLAQSDLAEKLFTSPQTISRWESGDGEPSLDLLISLAEILDVSADRLIAGNSSPNRNSSTASRSISPICPQTPPQTKDSVCSGRF